MKKLTLLSIFLLNILNLFAENWVGQAATYQLIEGTPTASKQAFSADKLTAASNGFKLGAVVEVTNVVSGKSVNVVINDRIEGSSKYFILLTPAAAKAIDLQWETGLVVVSADFNSLNSTERLPVGGLLPEDEDADKYKVLPKIEWPEDDEEFFAEEESPLTDDEAAASGEESFIEEYAEDELSSADDEIIASDILPEEIVPSKAEPEYSIESIPHDRLEAPYIPKKKEAVKTDEPVSETVLASDELITPIAPQRPTGEISRAIPRDRLFTPHKPLYKKEADRAEVKPAVEESPKREEVKKEEAVKEEVKNNDFKDIEWAKLDSDKFYIKFFSSSRHDDFAVKYFNFRKLFGDVLAVRRGNMYHLISTPVEEGNLDKAVNTIRNFGFRDAYIIKGNRW